MNGPKELWVAAFTGPHIDGTAHLALPHRWKQPDGREVADARYVRADIADEMLEALKAVREDAIKNSGRIGPSALLTMQAAIAKAEGESE